MRTTFGKIKTSLAKVLNMNASDSRVIEYCNRASERLLYEGHWLDTVVTYAVCVNSGCLTWPREIETIEAVSTCNVPLAIRDGWYEFLESGPGQQTPDSSSAYSTLIDRGQAVAFDDITTTGYKLAVYTDGTEDPTAKILLRYYDLNGNKVYTTVSGAREEGEFLTLPAAGNYVYSTYEVLPNGLYGVIKPVTNRVVRLYAYKISDATLFPLAYYEPDEEVPVYRRSLIPDLQNQSCTTGCSSTQVIVRAKLRFIPAYNDNSILTIPHGEAIRLAVQAIYKEENNMLDEALKYWSLANNCLDKQLHHSVGDGVVTPVRLQGCQSWGAGGVINIQ